MPTKPRDLVARTFAFARATRELLNGLPRTPANYEDGRQVIRSSGSVAANYLESQEGLSRKDFFYRTKVCRKEARESALWLKLIEVERSEDSGKRRDMLIAEAEELVKIFATIAKRDDTA